MKRPLPKGGGFFFRDDGQRTKEDVDETLSGDALLCVAVMSKNSADENLFGDAVHRGNSTKQRIRKSVQRRTAVRRQQPSVSYPPFVALHNLKRLEINKIKPSANC